VDILLRSFLTFALSLFSILATACEQDPKAPSMTVRQGDDTLVVSAGSDQDAGAASRSGTPAGPVPRLKRFDIMD